MDTTDPADDHAELLDLAQDSAHEFYLRAVTIGLHPFIEFTGLMNEWIKATRRAGTVGSAHGDNPTPLEDFERAYIREKLTCIFGDQLW